MIMQYLRQNICSCQLAGGSVGAGCLCGTGCACQDAGSTSGASVEGGAGIGEYAGGAGE